MSCIWETEFIQHIAEVLGTHHVPDASRMDLDCTLLSNKEVKRLAQFRAVLGDAADTDWSQQESVDHFARQGKRAMAILATQLHLYDGEYVTLHEQHDPGNTPGTVTLYSRDLVISMGTGEKFEQNGVPLVRYGVYPFGKNNFGYTSLDELMSSQGQETLDALRVSQVAARKQRQQQAKQQASIQASKDFLNNNFLGGEPTVKGSMRRVSSFRQETLGHIRALGTQDENESALILKGIATSKHEQYREEAIRALMNTQAGRTVIADAFPMADKTQKAALVGMMTEIHDLVELGRARERKRGEQ